MEKNNDSQLHSNLVNQTPQGVQAQQTNSSPSELITDAPTPQPDSPLPSQSPPRKLNWKKVLIIVVPIIVLILTVIVLVFYFFGSQKENIPANKTTSSDEIEEEIRSSSGEVKTLNLSKGIYAVHEGTTLNVYSSSLDGTDKVVLISREIGETNREPKQSILASVSPNGDFLAYKFPASENFTLSAQSTVTIIEIASKRELATIENIIGFSWSDDKKIQFTRRKPKPTSSSNIIIEAPLYPTDTAEYYLFDLDTRQEIKEDDNKYGEHRYVVNINNDEVVTVSSSAYGGVPNRLFLYNTSTKETAQIDMLGNEQVSTAITNDSQTRTVLSLLPKNWGSNHSCNIYEIRNYKLQEIVQKENYDCTLGRGSFYWNGENEFFYSSGTGPNEIISTSDTTKSGIYVLSSIYKYNFNTNTEEVILQSNTSKVYSIYGLLPGKAMVVNERSGLIDEMILQFRQLDGSNPVDLHKVSGNDTPYFIGWTK